MAIFAYSPAVWCYIKSLATGQTYDVSGDMVRGQTIHRVNAPHQMSVTLMNRNRRYDALFAPNDLFTIWMKRTRRLQIMSGYLDSVPWYSTWERSVQLYGTCTIKRLLQKRWDPGTQAAMNLIGGTGGSIQQQDADSGMMAKALAVITQVGGWPVDTIHIASLPLVFLEKVSFLFNAASPLLLGQLGTGIGGSVSLKGDNNPRTGATYSPQTLPTAMTTAQAVYFSLPGGIGSVTAVDYVPPIDPANIFCKPQTSYFCQINDWGYLVPGQSGLKALMTTWLAGHPGSGPVMVFSPNSNKTVLCEPVSQGPGPYAPDNVKIGLSKDAMTYLGITPADIKAGAIVYLSWCDKTISANHYPPGPWPSVTVTSKGKKPVIKYPAANTSDNGNSNNNTPYTGAPKTGSAQGAKVVATAMAIIAAGVPYESPSSPPSSFDCSSFAWWCWKQANLQWSYETTEVQFGVPGNPNYPPDSKIVHLKGISDLLPGDLVYYNNNSSTDPQLPPNHMGIFTRFDKAGNAWTAQAEFTGAGIHEVYMSGGGMTIMGFGRPSGYPGFVAEKGGATGGTGPTGATGSTGATGPGGGGGGGNGSTSGAVPAVEANTSPFNYWQWYGQAPSGESAMLQGVRGLLNDQPLLPFVNIIMNSVMRSWCSAPNGDFIAWFPDYFGAYGHAASIVVQDVELMDFSMSWSDQNMVTHQYVASSWASNSIGPTPAGTPQISNITQGEGVVTLEMGSLSNTILETVLNLKAGDVTGLGDPQKILDRFGARPNFQQMGAMMTPMAQFWYALFLFQLNWASMFTADIQTTFMPEAYPGMLVQLTDGFQAYINQVIHNWDFSDGGGGFTTQMAVMAPSDYLGGGIYGLPNGGKRAVV